MKSLCDLCKTNKPSLKRPKTLQKICKVCFFTTFEQEIHQTIINNNLFKKHEKVAIAASGGKDSTVLAYILSTLNKKYNYEIDLCLLSIDEGIEGYRNDSLESVKRNSKDLNLNLLIKSYDEIYGWTMDKIVKEVGKKNNCTFCGVFRRQALDRGVLELGIKHVVTGHNADDFAETVLMNLLRGDFVRLRRCCDIITQATESEVKRSKPFKYTYEKEIVLYAYFKGLDYFSTECIYSPNAFRSHARILLKDLEAIRPSSVLDVIYSGEKFAFCEELNEQLPVVGKCERCGFIASNKICKACVLLEGLNKGLPQLGIGKQYKKKYDKQLLKIGYEEGETGN